MNILRIDFSSQPTRAKPLTCLTARFDGDRLNAGTLQEWTDFNQFEQALQEPGPLDRWHRFSIRVQASVHKTLRFHPAQHDYHDLKLYAHGAPIERSRGGLPNHGNNRNAWKAGTRFDYENPEYRI